MAALRHAVRRLAAHGEVCRNRGGSSGIVSYAWIGADILDYLDTLHAEGVREVLQVPGDFPFVNHSFGHGQKGAIGMLRVEA